MAGILEKVRDLGIEATEHAGRAIALPASVLEVSSLVKLAREARAVLSSAPVPKEARRGNWLFVSLSKLDEVVELAAADLTAIVQTGATLRTVEELVGERDLYWPGATVAPAEASVGEVLSGAPGNWTLKGNLIRRYVLAVEAVLADGRVLQAGARTVKSVTGYDLKQLFIGSRGTLGVVTGATLRLEARASMERIGARFEAEFEGLESGFGGGGDVGEGDRGDIPAHAKGRDAAAGVGGGDAAAGVGSGDAGADARGGDAGIDILSRLKAEFDPDGVFPPVDIVRV